MAVVPADFGNPVASSSYRLCVYDRTTATPRLMLDTLVPAGGTCAGRACWKAAPTGFKYSDGELTPDGIQKVSLKAGPAGGAKIGVKGKGANLGLPALPLVTPVVVQLGRSDGGPCWQATYSAPSVNEGAKFSAKSD